MSSYKVEKWENPVKNLDETNWKGAFGHFLDTHFMTPPSENKIFMLNIDALRSVLPAFPFYLQAEVSK